MKPPPDSFMRALHGRRLLGRGGSVLVALSGGPDSTALLKLFLIVRRRLGLAVAAAHYNHRLRGRASDADEAFVRARCAAEGVPLAVGRAAPARARGEEAARTARYRFLLGVARRTGAALATGHTLDDQAETVLMRLLRGAGTRGLGAIPQVRVENGVRIIRPLLGVTRSEVRGFLGAQGLRFRRDASNLDRAFLRNRVRLELLPLLRRRYNAGLDRHLAYVAEVSETLYDYLHGEAERRFRRLCRPSGRHRRSARYHRGRGRIAFSRDRLRRLHPALRQELYFLAFEELWGSRRQLGWEHVEALEAALAAGPSQAIFLPRHTIVNTSKNSVIFRKTRAKIPHLTIPAKLHYNNHTSRTPRAGGSRFAVSGDKEIAYPHVPSGSQPARAA